MSETGIYLESYGALYCALRKNCQRITLEQVDQSKPPDVWKPLLADFGRRRHLSYSLDFDSRVHVFAPQDPNWTEERKEQHRRNQERRQNQLAEQFGSEHLDRKIANFIALGPKPFSVLAHHNAYFEQVRCAFVSGASYPALVGACALGERILNHLIIDLREFYKTRNEYNMVSRKDSFSNWNLPIDTLESWGVLESTTASEFRSLMVLRNRSIHFNVNTYSTVFEDALAAIRHLGLSRSLLNFG